jgi:hypothetical protein
MRSVSSPLKEERTDVNELPEPNQRKTTERRKAARRAYNRERYLRYRRQGLCASCGKSEPAQARSLCPTCAARQVGHARKAAEKLRQQVFAAYGGARCACCGEAERLFLCIDHREGGGYRHRKEIGAGRFYRWLRLKAFPPGYQVLCHNCNMGKMLNGGICPHLTKRSES